MKENPLELLINPQSIAFVGAGNNPMKMGTIQALSIVKDGYRGKFFPVHPTEEYVLGYKAYPSVLDLPETPDLAMFVVPPEQVPGLLEDFGKIGTRRAIIISAGFRETGAEGSVLEKKLCETASRYGIRFLGPNCMGILNTEISLNVTVLPLTGKPGKLGMASQSGTYLTQTLPYLRERGIRFSKAISVGNEADMDMVDALEFLGRDEQTRAIALYIEGLRDVRRFIETAREITPQKPVLAQYVGGNAAGARAGLSHTGAMAGPDHLYEGIFRQAGVIRVHSIEDLYGQGWALAVLPPLKGNRVAVLTNSGGPGSAMASNCDAGGLEMPLFSEELQARIRPHIAPYAACANPVDLTFHRDTHVLTKTIPELVMQSGEVDGIVLHGAMGTAFASELHAHLGALFGNISLEQFIKQFDNDLTENVSLPHKYNMPLIISSFFNSTDSFRAAYQENDVPVFDSPEKAARAMAALLQYKKIRERETGLLPELPPRSQKAHTIIREAIQRGERNLDEHSSKLLLAAYGIPVSRETVVTGEEEAVEQACRLGLPVVLKGCSPQTAHKTGRGLIYLDQGSEEEVRRSFRAIRKNAGSHIPVLVSEMVRGERELLAGMTRHPGIGPSVAFGLGGIFAEAIRDTVFRSAPLSMAEAREMIADLKAGSLLGPFRGMPAVDTGMVAQILQVLSFIAILHPEVAEIDLNPLIIRGSAPVAVDALFVLDF